MSNKGSREDAKARRDEFLGEVLGRHFDTAFAAPDGIKKLRELILALAMQGKLVAQDPNDPPASQLLKEIEAEKKRLVKAGKIKENKLLPKGTTFEVTQEIPKSWAWVRFGDIAQHNSGKTLDKSRNTGQPRDYITTSNLYWGRFELESIRQMLMRNDELERCTARKNDLLICEGGEAGRAAVWDFDSEVCFQNHVHRARFYGDIDSYYAYRFFEKLNATGEISQHRKGVGISNMSSKALASIAFPLPPLKEQRRIVAKIGQLMARCDELEKLRAKREQKRLAVHSAALKLLLDAQEQDGLTNAWQFVAKHFGELYSVKENVAELRMAILQLAVMGKLVPQNPNDPPASQLLKEIEAEKKRLLKAGKIKDGTRRREDAKEISPEEIPYELPVGWAWVRLEDVSLSSDSGWSPQCLPRPRADGDWGVLKVSAVSWGLFKPDENKALPTDKEPRAECEVKAGDFLLSRANTDELVARSVVVEKTPPKLMMSDKIVRFSLSQQVNKFFINTVNLSLSSRAYYIANASGTSSSMKNVSRKVMSELPVPLPPLPEQHRIVSKIDQLMGLCDSLDQQIAADTGKRSELLNAVMSQV